MRNFNLFLCPALFSIAASVAPAQVTFNNIPSRIVGQAILQQQGTITAIAPNLAEGRELFNPEGVTVDTSATPNIIYVADTSNNRVLAWKNAGAVSKGDFADKVIGQRDFYSTSAQGPTTALSTGLSAPLAVITDKSGNLYVADAGNNRIVRYPKPLQQTGDLLAIDLIIGQHDFSGHSANEGNAKPSAQTLYFSNNSSYFRTGLAFDSAGNLWVSDAGNNRVLRFRAADLTAGNNEPAADLVLGQVDILSNGLPQNPVRNEKDYLANPSGLAFDPQGRLFICDNAYRVLVYTTPSGSGQLAARVMGVVIATQANPNPPTISEQTLGNPQNGATPEGVFFVGNNPYVVDGGNARILKYDPYDSWPAEGTQYSPSATAVIGQPSFTSNRSNQTQPQPTASTFSGPAGAHNPSEQNGVINAYFAGTNLYVADSGNNRVLIFPQQSNGTFTAATKVLGQIDFPYNSPNLIEGRELYLQGNGSGIAIDFNSNPPHLYVSDPGNNRVLAYNDYRQVKAGVMADLVIGQPDFLTGMLNYPKNDPSLLNNQGLYAPEGLQVDANGNLWVADSGNGRVLRFPAPFTQAPGQPTANLVIGQASFFQKIPDASSQTMSAPYGIAFTADGSLLVSDAVFNRVLFFKKGAGDFTNGQTASNVFGQPNYGPPSEKTFSSPRMIAVDPDDRLYVADSGNNRVAIFPNVPSAGIDPSPTFSLTGLSLPYGVAINQQTGEVWVANSGTSQLLRYPRFQTLVTNPASTVTLTSFGTLAIGLDPFGNPVAAESINRVSFYYPAIDYTNTAGGVSARFSGNGANYFQEFAPAMIASIFAFPATHFGLTTALASSVPLPTTLGDVQVLVNGTASPLYYVSQSQINFQVPSNAPVGATPVEFQVVAASTGQILASGLFRIQSWAPGLFTADSSGSGQLLALNQDNTVNSATNPAKAGTIIQFFGTGAGLVSGAGPDGTPAPNSPLATDSRPDVYINGVQLAPGDITYSGLAPGFIGLWQINAKVPATVPTAGTPVPVAILYHDLNTRADTLGNQRTTTIRTTP
jgi:uncharacterized protein (TIGR03437 family)